MRVFAPGFGAGAVGGYVVMRVDPAIVSVNSEDRSLEMANVASGDGNYQRDFADRESRAGDRRLARHWTCHRA